MKRRHFLRTAVLSTSTVFFNHILARGADGDRTNTASAWSAATARTWLNRWQEHILGEARHRYCDEVTGEDIGWLMSPFLNGFYYGYLATGELQWVEKLADWTESWISRGVKEPDGFVGWPKAGSGGMLASEFLTDSLLGEAMAFRPVVLMAAQVRKKPQLSARFGEQAEVWLKLAEATFDKWVARGCWRQVKNGGLWVVPAFGLDPQTGRWTDGYVRRQNDGFTNPAKKQNHIARWLAAMHDVTRKPVYAEHARQWWQVMKSRMRTSESGKYFVWNYWDPTGSWDYNQDGSTRHWVGVHPNGGYYQIDVEGIATAFEHDWVFTKADIDRLIATNRDWMWNQQMKGARFKRLDGGAPDPRWKDSPGTLWTALVPYDRTLRRIFLATNDPASWAGLVATPWFLSREKT